MVHEDTSSLIKHLCTLKLHGNMECEIRVVLNILRLLKLSKYTHLIACSANREPRQQIAIIWHITAQFIILIMAQYSLNLRNTRYCS